MSETFNLKIIARKAKSDSNESHLFIRINLNQKRKEIGLKIKVENSKWNLKTQSLRGTTEQVRIILIWKIILCSLKIKLFNSK